MAVLMPAAASSLAWRSIFALTSSSSGMTGYAGRCEPGGMYSSQWTTSTSPPASAASALACSRPRSASSEPSVDQTIFLYTTGSFLSMVACGAPGTGRGLQVACCRWCRRGSRQSPRGLCGSNTPQMPGEPARSREGARDGCAQVSQHPPRREDDRRHEELEQHKETRDDDDDQCVHAGTSAS